MPAGVVYLMDGTKLAARLVVSLFTLRRHYSEPVAILSTDSAAERLCGLIASDDRLNVRHIAACSPEAVDVHRGYVCKALVNRLSPFDTSVFLDCDTLVKGDISPLFELPTRRHIIVTQFADWRSNGSIVRRRILSWEKLRPDLIDAALAYGPAVNTGVFTFTQDSEIFDEWYSTAYAGRHTFIPDEIAMQLLLPRYPVVMLDQRFNCSAQFGSPLDPDTRIVHYHGRKHVGRFGGLWIDAYWQATELNLGRIRDWTPAADRNLRRYLAAARCSI